MENEAQILFDVTLLLLISGIASIVFSRLRFPSIIGYIVAGAILGPHVPTGLVIGDTVISAFATIGLVLLMFYIGLELNLRGFKRVASSALVIAAVEMIVMIIIGYILGLMLHLPPLQAVVLGTLISGASTAIVLGTIKDRMNMKPEFLRTLTGILVMEDVGLIIILASMTSLVAGATSSIESLVVLLVEIVLFFGASIILGALFLPSLLDRVATRFSGETLLIVSLGLAFAMALISNNIGLSLAIGPFLMGIIVSQALCCDTILNKVEPMKELFMAVFFVAIGYQLDPDLLIAGVGIAIVIAVIFIFGKLLAVMTGCFVANYSLRSSVAIASSLVVIGEFSFVIAQVALNGGVIDGVLYSAVIGASLITMITLPLISSYVPKLYDSAARTAPPSLINRVSRMENFREEARRRMAMSELTRERVRHQMLMIFCDFIIIAVVLLAMNILIASTELFTNLTANARMISQIVLFVTSIALCSPAILNAIKRIQLISLSLTGEKSIKARAKNRAYRVFRNIGEIILFALILLISIPFMPKIEGLPPLGLFGLLIVSLVVGYLIWDTFKATYDRISGSIGRGVSMDERLKE